jgi:molybdate transport system substrate-binding protein
VRRLGALLVVSAILLPAGCGGEEGEPKLIVSAASSLKRSFTDYGEGFEGAEPRFSFAGSDELVAQIRRGARPDVFAAANTKLPAGLFREGLVERPIVFAANVLVIAVPADSTEVGSIDDLERPGIDLAIGAPSVPVGAYTRDVISRLGAGERDAILANVRSNEPDVASVVAKLTQGAADAGFVYVTDVAATKGELRAVELPDSLRPRVAYAAAVVREAEHPGEARRFVDGLLTREGARALERAGFEPPPK